MELDKEDDGTEGDSEGELRAPVGTAPAPAVAKEG